MAWRLDGQRTSSQVALAKPSSSCSTLRRRQETRARILRWQWGSDGCSRLDRIKVLAAVYSVECN
ncbi:hypothetical protein BO70DRAFT_193542 [Aspergillus heteromorphus CBS 117.55]|uniref:Uncharacterized protein n=1 Tax=Aspergillus heteromorphus CBS 117.55 TaxID=1448321 RepID=A0A317WNN1_9EURO|nr:uncharacterized protein BO70DRAFT_193542 [Aspergillus heteromorphus CBS 117.55]PWY87381.1 hypothetical protein BO70DRAFT_193542 [Aspergillus heteromorphus CBS 117.55]